MNNYYEVTDEQLAAVTLHTDESGAYHTVTSATDPDGYYTVRSNPFYKVLQCNCRAGREAITGCWHCRAVVATIAIEQDAARHEQAA